MSRLSLAPVLLALGATTLAAASPAPVPLEQRVLAPGELRGYVAPKTVTRQNATQFGAAHDKPTAVLNARGFVAGASARLKGQEPAFGISVAAQFRSPAQARTEAARLIASNGAPEEGLTTRPFSVPGIPGAKAVAKAGVQEGQRFAAFEVVFSDGAVTYELFALGLAKNLKAADIRTAARSLSRRTRGIPLP